MRSRALIIASLSAMLLAALGGSAASAGGGSVIMVDADGRATPASCDAGAAGSARQKVQKAIDAAPPGGTVLVCPGTYVEQLFLESNDGLTVRSTQPWKATIQAPTQLEAPFIVGLYDADDVTFQGFKVVARTTEDCDSPEMGILAVGGKGFIVRGNRVRNLGQSFGPCAMAVGIEVGYGLFVGTAGSSIAGVIDDPDTTATVAYNSVRDYLFLGIVSVSSTGFTAGIGNGSTRALISNNSVRYYHLNANNDDCLVAAQARLTSKQGRLLHQATAKAAAIAGPAGPGTLCEAIGIYQGAGTNDSPIAGASGDIVENRVSSGPDSLSTDTAGPSDPTPLQLVGILQADQKHTEGSSRVLRNLVFRNFFDIAAIDAKGTVIRDNLVRDSFVGIHVGDTEGGATVRDNDAQNNVLGIIVDNEPFDNSPQTYYVTSDVHAEDNDARGNFDTSCEDDTTGSGTEGTANTWIHNKGEVGSSSPEGICGRKSAP